MAMTDGQVAEPERTLQLAGGHNFRDLGGYSTADGGQVAWRKVFRSGTLANLTAIDHEELRSLGIRFICDLRTNRERRSYPTRWMEDHAIEIWARDYDHSTADLAAALSSPNPDAGAARAAIKDFYRRLPYEQSPSYAELLRRLAGGQVPLLFHCSAGKDRTGILGAVLLDLLGVERAVVIEDYSLSDAHFDRLVDMFVRDRHIHDIGTTDVESYSPLLRADPAYLEAMFEILQEAHGGTEGYVRDVLGLSAAEIAAIRLLLVS